MRRVAVFTLCSMSMFAQDAADLFNKPPADVDRALRARIDEFYSYHVKREPRKAEALVAEDTRDFFYSHNKPAYESCELKAIKYSDDFTHAKATIVCEQYVMIPGFADKPMKVPHGDTWKVEPDGKWYWYVDPEALRETPFGKMTPGEGKSATSIPAIPTTADFIMKQVQADKDAVTLKPGEEAHIIVKNGAPGPMTVSMADTLPGIEAKWDHTDINAGGQAVMTLRAGDGAKPGVLNIRIVQTGEVLPVRVTVEAAKPGAITPKTEPAAVGVKQVQLDKDAIALKPGKANSVRVKNVGPGTVTVSVKGTIPGVQAKLDRTSLPAGGEAVLTLRAGKGAKPGVLNIRVEQTSEMLPVRITMGK